MTQVTQILTYSSESNGKERLDFLKFGVLGMLAGGSVEWIFGNTMSQKILDSSERILVGQPPNNERHYHPRQAGQQLDLT